MRGTGSQSLTSALADTVPAPTVVQGATSVPGSVISLAWAILGVRHCKTQACFKQEASWYPKRSLQHPSAARVPSGRTIFSHQLRLLACDKRAHSQGDISPSSTLSCPGWRPAATAVKSRLLAHRISALNTLAPTYCVLLHQKPLALAALRPTRPRPRRLLRKRLGLGLGGVKQLGLGGLKVHSTRGMRANLHLLFIMWFIDASPTSASTARRTMGGMAARK